MSSLRDELIEVMVETLDEWEEAIDWHYASGRVLDAILDKLTEQRTDEVWVADTSDVFQQEVWLGQAPRQVLIADLAALRFDQEKPHDP